MFEFAYDAYVGQVQSCYNTHLSNFNINKIIFVFCFCHLHLCLSPLYCFKNQHDFKDLGENRRITSHDNMCSILTSILLFKDGSRAPANTLKLITFSEPITWLHYYDKIAATIGEKHLGEIYISHHEFSPNKVLYFLYL